MEAQRHQVAASGALGVAIADAGGLRADRATAFVSGTERERARTVTRTGRPWILAVLHAGVALAFLAALAGLPAVEQGTAVPWIVMAIAFAAVEMRSVDVQLAGRPVTVVLRELPLVVGLFFVAPVPLVAAQVAGLLAASVARRARLLDTALGMAATSLGTTVAIIVFRAIQASGAPASARDMAAVLAAAVVAVSITVAGRSGWRSHPAAGRDEPSRRSALALSAVAAVIDASLGMAVVTLIRTEPRGLWLLAAAAAIGVLGYRMHAARLRRVRGMQLLDEATRTLQGALPVDAGLRSLLERIRSMFGADVAEIILAVSGDEDDALIHAAAHDGAVREAPIEPVTTLVVGPGERPATQDVAGADRLRALFDLLPADGGRLLHLQGRPRRPWQHRGAGSRGDAALVPLATPRGRIGTLLVAGSATAVGSLDRADLRILEAVGSRVGAAVEHSRLTARLATSQADGSQLAALVTSFDDAIIAISPRGLIRTWNPAAERLFGFPAAQAVGRRVSRLLPREQRARAAQALWRVRAGAQVRDVDFEIVRADRLRVAVAATVSPILGLDGSVTGASAIIRDETNRRRAEADLRVTVDRFRGVFQGSPVGMGLVGPGFAWIRVNEALCRMLGRREDELVGEPSLVLVHPEDEEMLHDLLARVVRGDSAGSIVEARYVPARNRVVWVKITTRPLRDAGTRALNALCIVEDITERRHAEERARETEARFHRAVLAFTAVREPAGVLDAVLTAARDLTSAEYAAIAVLDEDGGVVDVVVRDPDQFPAEGSAKAPGGPAEQTTQVTQVVRAEATLGLLGPDGTPVRLLAEPRVGALGRWPAVPGLRSFLGVPIVFEGRLLAKLFLWNRRTAGGLDAGGFDRDDEKVAVALAAQAAISLENARIHDRDAALMRELDRTNADLLRANAARSAFLASISHELRTPLHSILAAAELIHDPLFGPYSERRARELGTTIQGSGRHLLHLIDDLVDLSRIEAGGMDLRLMEVPLGTILAEIRGEIAPLAAEKGVSLRVPRGRGPIVAADPLRLRQVLLNLLANAVKFTGRGGRIRVEVRRDGSGTTIAVHDTGIGIAPGDLERAFQPFEQFSGTNSPGAGLGLAISRRLVELHGGRLTVTSLLDHGSTFTVLLPPVPDPATDAAPARRVPAAALPKPAGNGRPILLVEDDETARGVLAEVLERGGYPVLLAQDVGEALGHLDTALPGLLVLDLQLGDEDGLAVARHVRAHREEPRLPILVLTAGGSPSDPERALAAGCDLYLAKPIGARELLGHVQRLLVSAEAEATGRRGLRAPRPTTPAGTPRGSRPPAPGGELGAAAQAP